MPPHAEHEQFVNGRVPAHYLVSSHAIIYPTTVSSLNPYHEGVVNFSHVIAQFCHLGLVSKLFNERRAYYEDSF